ncbi:MAG TPA: hypothetical protein V6D06_08590 [Trichocoleus sp.]
MKPQMKQGTARIIAASVWSIARSALIMLMLAVTLTLSSLWLGLAPGYAAETPDPEEQVGRAYDEFGQSTGIREEIYQERLQEGQDPEKMPKPYKRVPSFADSSKEVPPTSALETTVSRVREAVENTLDR